MFSTGGAVTLHFVTYQDENEKNSPTYEGAKQDSLKTVCQSKILALIDGQISLVFFPWDISNDVAHLKIKLFREFLAI